nr:sigma 54-interacting transcriptional regulator [uncultured Holophaga sp.]
MDIGAAVRALGGEGHGSVSLVAALGRVVAESRSLDRLLEELLEHFSREPGVLNCAVWLEGGGDGCGRERLSGTRQGRGRCTDVSRMHRLDVPIARGRCVLGAFTLEWVGEDGQAPADVGFYQGVGELLFPAVELLAREERTRGGRLKGGVLAAEGGDWVAGCRAMQEVTAFIHRVGPHVGPVLILGEAGTGRERVARSIHQEGRIGDFLAFSCRLRPGLRQELMAAATGLHGSLFLDEVAHLPLDAQEDLAELQRGDLRILAASRHDLPAKVARRAFSARLYGLMENRTILLPPLRERDGDILELAESFAMRAGRALGRKFQRISPAAVELLVSYPWPGNLRELERVMQRAVKVATDGQMIQARSLPLTLQKARFSSGVLPGSLERHLESIEYEILVEALRAARGNVTQAARNLGLTRRMMGTRMERYQLDYRTFR